MRDAVQGPLMGKRIVVTRQLERADSLSARLEAQGAQAILCPTIKVIPPASCAEIDRAISRIKVYRWVVFPSANSVRSVFRRMLEIGMSTDRLADVSLAAVGPATRQALEAGGATVSFVPDEYVAERLGETLNPVADERILVVKADIGEPTLREVLARRGAQVDEVIAYRTVTQPPPENAVIELKRGVDVLTFTSPSTVRGFLELGPDWRDVTVGVMIATIGPLTSSAVRDMGVEVQVEAEEHTIDGLVSALVTEFTSKADR
ncbi:MAG: hypothetical protein CME14_05425 [Gemmatimonadetes bacterium]|nr:hypothetical protein [Gemmatimonadota bacterium]